MTRRALAALAGGLLAGAVSLGALAETLPEHQARARVLNAEFSGGRLCDTEAFAELRTMRDAHGVAGAMGDALSVAFRGCRDDLARARLQAERLGHDASEGDQLKLAAAWVAAREWEQARAVAEPLAEAAGPHSRAAWVVGLALFHRDARAEAGPWLEGARGMVDGKKRADAPIMLALAKLERGEGEAAVAELRAAIDRMPSEPSLHRVLATVLQALGRPEDAAASADRARALVVSAAADERRRARFEALDRAWNHAHRTADTALALATVDRMAQEGAPEDVIALFERRLPAAERSNDALAERLRAHLDRLRAG